MYVCCVQASNEFDELMHVVNIRGSEVKVVLEPSAGYTATMSRGQELPTPADMEEAEQVYTLLKTDSARVTYSWDSPGRHTLSLHSTVMSLSTDRQTCVCPFFLSIGGWTLLFSDAILGCIAD